MIGRKKEKQRIDQVLNSGRAEFVAVTGRRRIGKTYLIDSLLKEHYCFSMTGIQHANLEAQLVNFAIKLAEYRGDTDIVIPANWQMAFLQLKTYLQTLDNQRRQVLFLDELPWIDTHKSGFLQMLAHFWNDYLSKEPHFIIVICGSATSWITKQVVNDIGGLHNRITENIHLQPFTLSETKAFLISKRLAFSNQDVARLYMSFGGVPYYLEGIQRGDSVPQAIERICFSPSGLLYNEYQNLYKALFSESEMHLRIVEALAQSYGGLSHQVLIKALGMKEANGSYQRALEDLLVSDFIVEQPPFGKKKKGITFRLMDEFTMFYHQFIKNNRRYKSGMWQQLAESQSYKIWTGFAFETLCIKHIDEIKRALGIESVFTEIYSLNEQATEDASGFQVDLVIDRKDQSMNLCEIKFHSAPITMSKEFYLQLLSKKQRFTAFSKTKKQVFLTMITNYPLQANEYSLEIVDTAIDLDSLLL